MRKDNSVYIHHISDCIAKIEEYTQGGKAEFYKSTQIQDAVIRNFEIIGEATKNLTGDFRDSNPHVQWRSIAAFRNFLIHDYFGVDLDHVWETVEHDLPELKNEINRLSTPDNAI